MKKERHLDRDSLDFGNERIPKLFRQLFFPTLIGMVFNALLTIIDGVFVGQGVGANGIAAKVDGTLLVGDEAPRRAELEMWLQGHPEFAVDPRFLAVSGSSIQQDLKSRGV